MKIYAKDLSDKQLEELIAAVQTGKYGQVGRELVEKEIVKYLRNQPILIDSITKKSTQKQLVKEVKAALYKGVGVFTNSASLEEHHSTRIRDYLIYEKIFKKTGIPKSIVDLGCGLNPLSYEQLGSSPNYIAIDINQEQIKQVAAFFKEKKINGKAQCKDILQMQRFPKAQMYFLFAFLDSVEQVKNHKISETIITSLPTEWIIVSFPTVTISGKQMNVPHRRWFTLMLERLEMKYSTITTQNEIFYIIHAQKDHE